MSDATVLHLPSGPTAIVAKIHPVVIFNVCDCYIRRNEGQERVIGTLLGSIGADGVVEVKNSFAVPHNESSDQVAVDIDFHRTMFELNQRVNPKEVIVGWYSSGSGLSGSDALIQDFYVRETPNPIHLTVDPSASLVGSAERSNLMKAYVSTALALGERRLVAQFQEIQLDFRMVEAERIGFELLGKTVVEKLPSDLDGLEETIARLQGMVESVSRYTDDVLAGRIPPDNAIGRYLADTVAAVPQMSSDTFDKMFNDSVQDLLLVLYLANLTRAQLVIAEKLNSAAQPAV
eukprot:TRINITY_DN28408_c0_g1_i1.p1 TRINITY_DN28408_c0_g1~~TRINITY_DN28408_c0_g1_i1.p1  ORF type:complete len:290 (-),score=56.98 TRINITY_DN28408_c0_g1_i1:296-1165(-)